MKIGLSGGENWSYEEIINVNSDKYENIVANNKFTVYDLTDIKDLDISPLVPHMTTKKHVQLYYYYTIIDNIYRVSGPQIPFHIFDTSRFHDTSELEEINETSLFMYFQNMVADGYYLQDVS